MRKDKRHTFRLMELAGLAVLLAGLCSCEKETLPDNEKPALVVEGWIENNDFPVVIVTKTMSVNTEYQSMTNLEDYVVRWAKVTVSDGEQSEVLTGRYDDMFFPPYIYTTSRMKGEVGKTYSLKVEYEDACVTAKTTICEPPALEEFRVEKCQNSDTLYQITACFNDFPEQKNYYQFFTKVGENTAHYLVAFLGSVDDDALQDETIAFPVYRGHMMNEDSYTPFFSKGEKVSVKFAQVDAEAFRFWQQYSQAEALNANMFLSVPAPLPSNINGGTGYWCGYGAVNAHFIIGDPACY